MASTKYNTQRVNARKSFFDRLIEKHESRCHFCGEHVKRMRDPDVLETDRPKGTLLYCHDGKTYLGGIATIEHIVPLAKGGGNGIENMVLCCQNCNHERNVENGLIERQEQLQSGEGGFYSVAGRVRVSPSAADGSEGG